jgi:hypothetical protein
VEGNCPKFSSKQETSVGKNSTTHFGELCDEVNTFKTKIIFQILIHNKLRLCIPLLIEGKQLFRGTASVKVCPMVRIKDNPERNKKFN